VVMIDSWASVKKNELPFANNRLAQWFELLLLYNCRFLLNLFNREGFALSIKCGFD
jgi:hypothetical protein